MWLKERWHLLFLQNKVTWDDRQILSPEREKSVVSVKACFVHVDMLKCQQRRPWLRLSYSGSCSQVCVHAPGCWLNERVSQSRESNSKDTVESDGARHSWQWFAPNTVTREKTANIIILRWYQRHQKTLYLLRHDKGGAQGGWSDYKNSPTSLIAIKCLQFLSEIIRGKLLNLFVCLKLLTSDEWLANKPSTMCRKQTLPLPMGSFHPGLRYTSVLILSLCVAPEPWLFHGAVSVTALGCRQQGIQRWLLR